MELFRHSVELVINPFFLCLILLGISSIWFIRRSHGTVLRVFVPLVFIVLMIISTGWLPRWLTWQLESKYPVVALTDPKVKWIVVLSGGQSHVPGMPANDLLFGSSMKRLVEGVRLLQTMPAAQLVLSGGNSMGGRAEATVMEQVGRWFAIPKQKIILEIESTNTADQARALRSIVHEEPFYLVTSAIHMPRAMTLCLGQGLHPIAAPTDYTFYWQSDDTEKLFIPNTYNLNYFSIALHEMLGRIWARLANVE